MATGGTGDVLTGVISALIAQGLSAFEAAQLGAHVHGLAGDLAAKELGMVSLTALDVVEWLPKAFLGLANQRK
jgi:NAD(P)H-hydrate epimerase